MKPSPEGASSALCVRELSDAYASRTLSPVEVLDALAARIDEVEPEVNAFAELRIDKAYDDARAAERRYRRNARLSAIDGVPIGVKDVFDVAGMRVTFGSRIFTERISSDDAVVVARLRNAGALILGMTTTHEFGWGMTTDNPWAGPTRNPWNTAYVPGGSSGGSAAAVAAHEVPLALGTDGGGSIRNPANFCGVAGLKPTYGAVSRQGALPFAPSLDHVGPIARNPGDLVLAMSVMVDPPYRDSSQREGKERSSLDGVRIGISHGAHNPQPSRESSAVLDRVVGAMRELGAQIVHLEAPPFQPEESYRPIQLCESLAVHRALGSYPSRRDEYGSDVRERLELAETLSPLDYMRAAEKRQCLGMWYARAFEVVDAIVSPASACQAAMRGEKTVEYDGRTMSFRESVLEYMVGQNLSGVPAVVFCAGFGVTRLPIGIQLTSRWWSDYELLRIAHAVYEYMELVAKAIPTSSQGRSSAAPKSDL